MINFKKVGPPAGGGKKTLVFLHGWGGTWQSWTPIINSLQSMFKSKYTIYALDLPGFGLSPLPRAYSLADYVEEVRGFIQKEILGPARMTKVVLIGHSFGGQVAIKFGLTNPELVSGLVLVDAAGVRNNSASVLAHAKIARFGKNILLKSPLAGHIGELRKKYYRLLGMSDRDYLATPDEGFLKETLGVILRDDLSRQFSKIKSPTLIFWGEKDEPCPVEWARILNREIEGSKLVVVPGAGHFSYLDDPDGFISNLHQFVTNLH